MENEELLYIGGGRQIGKTAYYKALLEYQNSLGDMVPLKYNDVVIGYVHIEDGDMNKGKVEFTTEAGRKIMSSFDKPIGISSRKIGFISEDGKIIEMSEYPKEFCIINNKKE
jgi:hypothetical protein